MAVTKTKSAALLDNVTVQESASSSASTAVDISTALQCSIEVKMTFHGSATNGATVAVYGSGDNTNWDTGAYDEFDIPVSAGSTVQHNLPILPSPKYVRVVVSNLDAVQDITALYVYAVSQNYA